MAVTENPQSALDERDLGNQELEQALERREKARQARSRAVKAYELADGSAKAMLAEFQLTDGEVARCGRFRIVQSAVPSRAVSFETEPTSRVTIKPVVDTG